MFCFIPRSAFLLPLPSPCHTSGQDPQLSPRGHPCPYPRAALEPPSPCSVTWWAPPAADRALQHQHNPQGAAFSSQGASGTGQVPPDLQAGPQVPHGLLPKPPASTPRPAEQGLGSRRERGGEDSAGIPWRKEAAAKCSHWHVPHIQLPQSRPAVSASAALPGKPLAIALS